jgi:drug/metabolite transporter (DMT)-like permease
LLVAIGITATIGQLLSTEAYRYVQVPTGSLLGMLVPVMNYFVGVMVFNEVISWRSIIGTAAVLGSCVVVLLRSNGK